MRRSLLLPALALTGALTLAAATAASADSNVHGVRAGTQHSPSVALTPTKMYVLSYDSVDTTTAANKLRLAVSFDAAQSFQDVPLPFMPQDWYWRPDGHIVYDELWDQFWMVAQARTVGADPPQVGIYVAVGRPDLDGTIDWSLDFPIWLHAGSAEFVPQLAVATGDGTGAVHVLFNDAYGGLPGTVRHYRIEFDQSSVFSQVLAAPTAGVLAYTAPTLGAGPNGAVVAGWVELPAGLPAGPGPFVTRTSSDGGMSFGAEETIGSLTLTTNGPGSTLGLTQKPTLLIAKHSFDFPATRMAFWASRYEFLTVFDPSDVFFNSDCCQGLAWNKFGSMLPRQPFSYETHPAVTMADDGYFYIGWHDFQPFDPDSVSQFMVTRLWNMGISAAEPVPLAASTFDWDNVVSNLDGMGWQSAAAAYQGYVTFAWGDHRGADPDVYARSFRAEGFAVTEGCGDTLEVTAGQDVKVEWRVENRNELFTDEFGYIVGSTRPWTNGLEPDTVVIAADGFADVSYTISVPDTAADAVIRLFPTANDRVRFISCTSYLRIHSLVAVEPGAPAVALALSAPRPNPSAGATSFTFTLPAAAEVDVAIYDLRGRRVATLAQGTRGPGVHAARWDGAGAPAGIYFARLSVRVDSAVMTREQRLVVLR